MTTRRYRPFTPEEDARMIEMRLGAPGYSGVEKIAAVLCRRPATITNRLKLLGKRDPALNEKLDTMRRIPRAEPDVDPIVAALRSRRKELGLSRPALGKISGYSRDSIESWERGRRLPSMQALCDCSTALGMRLTLERVK